MFGFFDSKQDKINKSITNLINTREVLLKRLPSLYQFKEFPLSTRDLMFFSNEQRAAYTPTFLKSTERSPASAC